MPVTSEDELAAITKDAEEATPSEEPQEAAEKEKETEPEEESEEEPSSEPVPKRKKEVPIEKEVAGYGIYAIRTTANKEKNVASKLYDRTARDGYNISAIIVPGLRGYILVEGDRSDIDKAYRGVAHARGLVDGRTSIGEIAHFLAPTPAVTTLEEGYIVEVTAGPFKGEKAKITRVDKLKNEIIIELLEATVPIPITVLAESVRVLEKEEGKKKEEKEGEGKEEAEKKPKKKDYETEDPFKL